VTIFSVSFTFASLKQISLLIGEILLLGVEIHYQQKCKNYFALSQLCESGDDLMLEQHPLSPHPEHPQADDLLENCL